MAINFNSKRITSHWFTFFSEKKATPTMASSRIQRWALTLGAYSYTIQFRKGSQNCNADALSRLPLSNNRSEPPKPADVVHLMEYLDSSPISSSQIPSPHRSRCHTFQSLSLQDGRVNYPTQRSSSPTFT